MNGCTSRRVLGTRSARLAKRMFAVFLSLILISTAVPAVAWAQVADSVGSGLSSGGATGEAPAISEDGGDSDGDGLASDSDASSEESVAESNAAADGPSSADEGASAVAPNAAEADAGAEKASSIATSGDSSQVESECEELASKLDAAFTSDALTYLETGDGIDADSVSGDLRLPTPSELGIDEDSYSVTYASSSDVIEVDGYRGNVSQPSSGAQSESVDLVLTVTSKSNTQVSASKTLSLSVAPLAEENLEASVAIIGVDADGNDQTWLTSASHAFEEGDTAADLTERALEAGGIEADFVDSTYGWYLNTITSPFDGRVLGWDESTGKYWQLFVNGELASAFASSIVLEPGDSVVWYYSADAALPGHSLVSVSVVGRDSDGNAQDWGSVSVAVSEGDGAREVVCAALDELGLVYETESAPDWDAYTRILSVTSPFDGGVSLVAGAVDEEDWSISGDAWYLACNGKGRDVWLESVDGLSADDEIVLYYGEFNKIPEVVDDDGIVIDPDASRPDGYESSWPSFAGTPSGAVTDAFTPTQAATSEWVYEYGADQGASDPLIVNGDVYLVSGSMLMRIDGDTGELVASASIGSSIRYFCRPAYADGLIIVPSDDGRLTAFTADALIAVWRTDALDSTGSYQSLSSLTVANGCVYAAFTVPGGAYESGSEGSIVCVSLESGELLWKTTAKSSETGESEGYYWAGAAVSGDDIVIGNEAGRVALIDGTTGEELSSVNIGSPCRAGIVVSDSDENTMFAVSRDDGTLYKIVREGDSLRIVGSVTFAAESTSTPAIVGGKAYVCGMDAEGYGTLSVIDVESMSVETTVRGGKGASQSSPLVSVQSDGIFVYFTCNARPGCVYGYRVGDVEAYVLYTPDEKYQQYCTASVICDEAGNLYYTNDAGVLFKLAGREGALVSFDSCGGSAVAPLYVAVGTSVARPSDPTREGYSFAGWYIDEAYGVEWDFADSVTGSMTLYAKWKPIGGSGSGSSSGGGTSSGSNGSGGSSGDDGSGSGVGDGISAGKSAGAVAPGATPVSGKAGADDSSGESASVAADARTTAFSSAAVLSDGIEEAARGSAENAAQSSGENAAQDRSVPLAAFIGLGIGVVCLVGALGWLMASRRRGA